MLKKSDTWDCDFFNDLLQPWVKVRSQLWNNQTKWGDSFLSLGDRERRNLISFRETLLPFVRALPSFLTVLSGLRFPPSISPDSRSHTQATFFPYTH